MHSQSLSTGRVTEGRLTLRPNAAAAEDPEQFHAHNIINISDDRQQSSQAGVESGAVGSGNGNKNSVDQSIIGYEEPILLTQSTHSFLFTEPICSLPFSFALGIVAISYTCLILALFNNIAEDNSSRNFFNVPVGVTLDVKIAQYLSLLIGLIMEEEIPESLYLLRMISKETLRNKTPNLKFGKFVFSACVRIMMGYLFYLNMFTVVAQATAVIDMFYDVLALQFLQQVDDIVFKLARWDVFGKRLKRASTKKCFRAEFEKLPFVRRKKMTIFVKVVYIINLCGLMAGMTVVSIRQRRGDYHCNSITVNFDDHIWENALVLNSTGGVEVEEMDLIYSYFNGVYVLNGTHAGRPIYTEQNKFNNTPYEEKIGAIIKYCEEESAWVFMHENIRKDRNTKNSDCPWLLRSPETKSFNLLEVDSTWSIWTGIINTGSTFQATCNRCDSKADCNYHGTCTDDGKCDCYVSEVDGYPLYTGTHCEFSRPCIRLAGSEGGLWDIIPMEIKDNGFTTWKAYGRAVYLQISGGDITTPEEDGVILLYTGSRWFGSYYEGVEQKGRDYWLHYSRELHAFWDQLYKENTQYVSNPTSRSDPIAVDFFEIGKRGAKYGPLGELIPLQEPPGSGLFECSALNMSINDFVSGVLEALG
mmetsp:Transcript_35784/g.58311  ORF Transcript_35784/g.58311 Transcript_35784/m.58311 type:complete len:644 (-) Transcript_35784:81-2012(-)|eukprot:CAMPEP_0201963958 /NCGR_PEP_ID=MMETSP0904-20121228/9707_1 /ASSEMBLY_ACC=CAM_ASM_000553 /TAXON_ID=420261 /ORGANISM="Thalassiosira antarctica, Strain CCMP982" /LENGTH=643 /DNA_ID=CAMNT_0048510705 /DNA_START=113 /DNA_END=2044 /DNA_ORIENTATION=-